MKEKRHLVMWVEFIVLAVLLARLEIVRIRENTKAVHEYTCVGRKQEGAQNGYGKREEKAVSDKVIGAGNSRLEKKLEENVTEKKKAALTFDDGPNSQYTPLLLKGLKERGVHATFFLMGKNIEGKEALVKQIQEEGHLIGNHTYNHVQLDKISKEAAKEEIEATNQKIFEISANSKFYQPGACLENHSRNLHALLCGIFHHGILRNCHNRFSNFSPYKSPADRKSHVLDTSLRTFHSSGRQTLLSLHSYL